MQFVNLDKFQRYKLNQSQREFFLRVVPLSIFVQEQTIEKSFVTEKETVSGIFSSIICANIILRSNWGTHPVAQQDNLALLLSHKFWKKSVFEFEGIKYKSFKNWREFAIEYSDVLAWQNGFERILKINSRNEQLKALVLMDPNLTYDKMAQVIQDFGLSEFDIHGVS